MGKPKFHTLSFINDLKTGKVGKRISINRKENNMTTYKRNERNPNDGSGVPDMPKLNFGNQRPDDPLELLKTHMVAKHGQTQGLKLLRVMTAEDAVRTLELIQSNKPETTGILKGNDGQERYVMPSINWNK